MTSRGHKKGLTRMPETLKVIEVAKGELGYHEGSNNSNKYAKDLDAIPNFYNGIKQNQPWCDIFVDWCFVEAYGEEIAKQMIFHNDCGAGCYFSAKAYQEAGRFDKTPQVGDQIFYRSGNEVSHTGLVCEVHEEAGYVKTIEGNYSDSVSQRTVPLNISSIYGFGHPDYSLASYSQVNESTDTNGFPSEQPESNLSSQVKPKSYPVLKYGDKNDWVAVLQAYLIAYGFKCGEIDGEFGVLTEVAVMQFQKAHHLEIDAICGNDTWSALTSFSIV